MHALVRSSIGIAVGLAVGAGCAPEPVPPDPGDNLILITLDGVRGQELFGLPNPAWSGGDSLPVFPQLHAALAESGVMFGDSTRFDPMTTTNNTGRSLPGYMSIFAGYEQDCYDNDCRPIGVETVLEYVQRKREWPRGEVAVFASWQKLGRAVEQVVGTLVTDIAVRPGDDPACVVDVVNRTDVCTWRAGMAYLDEHRPRLLYVSLLDADAYGHKRDYGNSLAAMRRYDGWIAELRRHLAEDLGEYGARTTIIITTDHGRGDGDRWFEHNTGLDGSEKVWLAAFGPQVNHGRMADTRQHTHGDIRPTIEVLFGLPPLTCTRCGLPLTEVIGPEHAAALAAGGE